MLTTKPAITSLHSNCESRFGDPSCSRLPSLGVGVLSLVTDPTCFLSDNESSPPKLIVILEANAVTDQIVHVSDDTFETEVLSSDKPVLVDYWAEWCGPCKMIAPILQEVAEEYADKLKVVKLNIDENPATPPRYGIRGIPTLMLFRNGNVEATKVGALSKSQLAAFIDSNL